MKYKSNVLALILLSFVCNCIYANELDNKLQTILDSTYAANPDAVGIQISIISDRYDISWKSAAGYTSKDRSKAVSPDNPVLIASNTKTYVAAAIIKLAENGSILLDKSISNYLSQGTNIKFVNAGYDTDSISIKHLLSHSSGIRDYVDSVYFEYVRHNPRKNWTIDEQIDISVSIGTPLWEAGKGFIYGDINYILLTEIIENITDNVFYEAIPALLKFKELGIYNTWFAKLQDKPKDAMPLAEQYYTSEGWQSGRFDPSWDLYGGGGLISTVHDMSLFYSHLFGGKIIVNDSLLSKMHEFVLPSEMSNYCLGLRKIDFHGYDGYYHGGFWGTDSMYLPKYDLTISVSTLEKDKRYINADLSNLLLKIIEPHLK